MVDEKDDETGQIDLPRSVTVDRRTVTVEPRKNLKYNLNDVALVSTSRPSPSPFSPLTMPRSPTS